MPRPWSRLPATAASLALSLLLAAGPAAHAQGSASDAVCGLLTPAEVGEALGTTVTAEASSSDYIASCSWTSSDPDAFAFLDAEWEAGTLEVMSSGLPGGVELNVGGQPAYYQPDLLVLFIGLEDGVLTLAMDSPDVDIQAALTSLGELAVPRAATLPTPPAEPSVPPQPSFDADAELEVLFPATIGGEPLTIESMAGAGIFAQGDPQDIEEIRAILAAQGRTIDDVSFAFGYASDFQTSITAFRVAGGDATALATLILESMTGEEPVEQTTAQVAGKDVTVLVSEGRATYVHTSGEVVWMVNAEEPALTEILAALP